jgi:hypothetical protein
LSTKGGKNVKKGRKIIRREREGMIRKQREGCSPKEGMIPRPMERMIRRPKEGMIRRPKEGMIPRPMEGMIRRPMEGMIRRLLQREENLVNKRKKILWRKILPTNRRKNFLNFKILYLLFRGPREKNNLKNKNK